jgi:uncharacterized protein involved in type VI secretion and phage assembly
MSLPAPADGSAPGYYGVYPALVTKLVDEDHGDHKYGRVEVSFPTLGHAGEQVTAWATLCSPYADDGQGLEVLPEVGSQVVVAFEAGNPTRPYILGAAWNGKAALPTAPEKANNIRVLKSRATSKLEFDDTKGAAKVTLESGGGHKVMLDDGGQTVTVQHSGGTLIRIEASGAVTVFSKLTVDVTATAVNVTSPMSTFSGIVKCSTLMADAFVVSPAYTPGVGNLL